MKRTILFLIVVIIFPVIAHGSEEVQQYFSSTLHECKPKEHYNMVALSVSAARGTIDPCDYIPLSQKDLRIVRNSIFARHGRAFKSTDLRKHFNGKAWYKVDKNYTDKVLSDREKDNINTLKAIEDLKNGQMPLPEVEDFTVSVDALPKTNAFIAADDKTVTFLKTGKTLDLYPEKTGGRPGETVFDKRESYVLGDKLLVYEPWSMIGLEGRGCTASLYDFDGSLIKNSVAAQFFDFCPNYFYKNDLAIGIHDWGCCGAVDYTYSFQGLNSKVSPEFDVSYYEEPYYLLSRVANSDNLIFGYTDEHSFDCRTHLFILNAHGEIIAKGKIVVIDWSKNGQYLSYGYRMLYSLENLQAVVETVANKSWVLEFKDHAGRAYFTLADGDFRAPKAGVYVRLPYKDSARVYIDGVLKGGTPYASFVETGTHTIKVSLDGYVPEVRKVKLEHGDVKDAGVWKMKPVKSN